jgi:putative ubiquitin-RnfH superfamily antitoxin RatB of RatAB toxin-antitoxin module
MAVIEVAYALPCRQTLLRLEVEEGAPLGRALELSGILGLFPEIDLATAKVGIYGKPAALDTPLRDGDRVEIYRPLNANPKEVRKKAAEAKPQGDAD